MLAEVMSRIRLNPMPDGDEWADAWERLMQDPWLVRKLDRQRRLRDHIEYLQRNVPEFLAGRLSDVGTTVIDIGPGAGELLEIAQAAGFQALGIDAGSHEGGMGRFYLRACRLIHQRQELNVLYCGMEEMLLHAMGRHSKYADLVAGRRGQCALINMRGSLEQVLHDCLEGPPHHLHQDCSKLKWRDDFATRQKVGALIKWASDMLAGGGVLLIHANGAANTSVGDQMLQAASHGLPLTYAKCEQRLHKWFSTASQAADEGAGESAVRGEVVGGDGGAGQ